MSDKPPSKSLSPERSAAARARLADPSAYSRAASREGFRRVRGAYVKVAP